MIKICEVCKNKFKTWHSPQKFCSRKCRGFYQRKKIIKICNMCKKEFLCYPSQIGKFCSRKCKDESFIGHIPWNKGIKGIHCSPKTEFKKGDKRITGKNNFNWKGGKTKTIAGYILMKSPNSKGYWDYDIMEHRYIMEKHLKRKLFPNEIIHHRNGIKYDNRIENLQLVIRKTHFGNVQCPHCLKEFLIK